MTRRRYRISYDQGQTWEPVSWETLYVVLGRALAIALREHGPPVRLPHAWAERA